MNALSRWCLQLRVMFGKELRQLGRDRVLLAFIVYAFTVDIFLAASGVSLQLKLASTYVQDVDHSSASRELASRFLPPYFQVKGELEDERAADAALSSGRAMLVLTVPAGFGEDLARVEPTRVQLQVDTSNAVLGFLAASYAEQIVARFGLETLEAGKTPLPVIENRTRVWFNPNQEDSWFMGISELLNVITIFSVLLPAAAAVREKERGTIEQLLVSPLTPLQILLPKVLSMTVVILAGTALALWGVLRPCFGVPMAGSVPAFFALTALYVFTSAGFGLLAATVARNLAQAGMLTILILAPMLFLSGAWTPPEAMPEWLAVFTHFSPLYYFINISFGLLLKGQSVAALWPSVFGMMALGMAAFAAGLLRFRRQFG